MTVRWLVVAGVVAAACRPAPVPAIDRVDSALSSDPAVPPEPADTMVLATGPYRIWLAEGRTATDSLGTGCYERSVEIRTDSGRTKVPLLYVREAPTVLDRDHLRAVLSYACHPMAVYRVELATGRPSKIEDR